MEHPQLIRGECANDRVQQTAVVEQDQISLVPVLRVHHLRVSLSSTTLNVAAHLRGYTGTLDLVQRLSDLLQVGDDTPVRVQLAVLALSLGQRVDVQLVRATRMDLDVQLARTRVLPALRVSARPSNSPQHVRQDTA